MARNTDAMKRGFNYKPDASALAIMVNGTETQTNSATGIAFSVPVTNKVTLVTKTSAAGYTASAAEVLGGLISDTTSTGAIAVAMPTVAAVVALLPGWVAGTSFRLIYKNPGNQTVTLTTDASSQWTMTGTMTVATTKYREFICVINTATTGTVYSLAAGDY